jgi:hypothetical protein
MKQREGNLSRNRRSVVEERTRSARLFKPRNSWIPVLMWAVPLFGQPIAAEKTAEPPAIRVRVECYNYARVPNSVMTEGFEITERIFGQAGVQVLWTEVRLDSTDDPKTAHDDDRTSKLCLRILPEAMSNRGEERHEAIGSAFPTDDNTGFIANVFYQRLEGLGSSVAASRGTMLGNVIAHELGHLLLGRNSHSGGGIMSANWQRDGQIVRLRAGSLFFTPQEAQRIKYNILERERKAPDRP